MILHTVTVCNLIVGIIRRIGEAAEKFGISIHAILQNPIDNYAALDFVVTTEDVMLSQVSCVCVCV